MPSRSIIRQSGTLPTCLPAVRLVRYLAIAGNGIDSRYDELPLVLGSTLAFTEICHLLYQPDQIPQLCVHDLTVD